MQFSLIDMKGKTAAHFEIKRTFNKKNFLQIPVFKKNSLLSKMYYTFSRRIVLDVEE